MLKQIALLTLTVATLVGCASSAVPSWSLPGVPAGTVAASTGPWPIAGAAGSAIVVTVLDDNRPFFDLVVEAIAPNGVAQPLATFRDVHPTRWTDATPLLESPILGSAAGSLLVSVQRDGGGEPRLEAALLLDLNNPSRPPIELPAVAERAAWGPSGELAVFGQEEVTVVDPKTGSSTRIAIPNQVDPLVAWTVDASGWLAVEREGDDDQRSGTLHRTGAFEPTVGPVYGATGLERRMGSKGEIVSEAVSDGADGAEAALVDFGPGICPKCIVWARSKQPGDDPSFGDYAWDAAGAGLWLVRTAADGKARWLAHLPAPRKEDRILDLPARGDLAIVGLAPDDRWLVFATDDGRHLLVADTAAGTTRQLAATAGAGSSVVFAGWSQVPTN